MRVTFRFGALACAGLFAMATPQLAHADDPNDPAMKNRALRAADAAEIRRLNREQAAYVKARDAEYAKGWQDWRQAQGQSRQAEADARAYREARNDYEAEMAQWRRDVAACRSGAYERCAR